MHPLAAATGDYGEMADADVGFVRTGFVFTRPVRPRRRDPVYDWTNFDAIVTGAAEQGIDVLPVLRRHPRQTHERGCDPARLPGGDRRLDGLPDRRSSRRYGPDGDFWTENPLLPKHPIEDWQVWNEPNSFNNWAEPDPKRVREAAVALGEGDPRRRPGRPTSSPPGSSPSPVNRRAEARRRLPARRC